ncbi:SGNH/GDSL hydrolase family protein [Klebsiella pneumoniae]|uniref:SGNH/GDSL hydrolase family protein n=1 Tax=Klebsiella pneumoniae TaxID=573 RepID=UPI000808D2D2|nr:SGNH/GDSL hydrolase family protein [Klebsiella pneumoniae]SBW89906.1 flagellar biosynthesis, cell-distal portion of basal-body rod [Klebsiella pneumoniae]SBX16465.1 flagellar biosynthesis, cell-distal portion of basal-body rod [Klebsiella pneumoniae]SBZ85146.1 flagellar biosynthesis, cell-distal portion of basal-body rod [Klebsiella pneumoniae]SCA64726.1 flagellar biosynthesis, cell-distal portion of basal-body rod [Klebsiella pneumoniae]
MAFNPELGSTSPAVLLDNAERLDKLVNGSALTEPDRAGDDLDTWRGMMAKNEALTEETRQNLIPLSRQYATLADAQADIANIPVGSTTYYRSPDDSALAVEVINNGGTLQPTGRQMPSKSYLDSVSEVTGQIYSDVGRGSLVINYFDKERTTDGFAVGSTGSLVANAAYFVSDMIPALDGTQYVFAVNVSQLAFYDLQGNFISYVAGATAGTVFTTPARTRYIRFSQTLSTGKSGQMLIKGASLPAGYIGAGLVDPFSAKRTALEQAIDISSRSNALVRNLFDKNRANDGYALSTNGSLTANASYFVTDYIPVLPGESYILSSGTQVLCFYDPDLSKTSNITVAAATAFTVPTGSYYLRFQGTPLSGKESLMVVRGTSLPSSYVGFGALTTAEATAITQSISWGIADGTLAAVRNMFNKDVALDNYALSTTGAPYAAAGYFVTPFIPVKPNTQYIASRASGVVVYFDINKTKISNTTFAASTAFTTPEWAVYVRFQVFGLADKNTLMLIEGAALPTSYLSFGSPTASYVDTKALTVARSVALSLQKVAVNLYNSELAQIDRGVSYQTGGLTSSPGYFATPMIMVTPGDSFVSTYGSGGGAFYKADGTFLSGFQNLVANTPYAVPDNAYFVRFQVYNLTRLNSLMVSPGQTVPAGYVPFGGQGQELPWQGKGIGFLGDSITNTGNYIAPLLSRTGMRQIANYGVPGQGVRTMANSLDATTIADMDFISILGGTNDYGGNRRLGTIADARADYDDTTVKSFYYDVFFVLNKIYTLKPTVRVMFSTPMKRGAFESQPVYPAANSAGFTLPQYVQAIREVCALFSVPVCDLFAESGINLYNLSLYTGDNLHPNAAGGELIARRMASVVNML